jgi:hypothetical protein
MFNAVSSSLDTPCQTLSLSRDSRKSVLGTINPRSLGQWPGCRPMMVSVCWGGKLGLAVPQLPLGVRTRPCYFFSYLPTFQSA